MKKLILQLMVIVLFTAMESLGGSFDWVKRQTHSGRNILVNDISRDLSGGLIVVGSELGCITCNTGFIRKYDSLGTNLFTYLTWPGYPVGYIYIDAVANDYANNIYLTFRSSTNTVSIGPNQIAFPGNAAGHGLVKLSPSGSLIWWVPFPSSGFSLDPMNIAVDSAGNVFYAFNDTLGRVNSNGSPSWSVVQSATMLDVERSFLAVGFGNDLKRISKSTGALLSTITVPDLKAMALSNNGDIYYSGSVQSGRFNNTGASVWTNPSVQGEFIDFVAGDLWIAGKAAFDIDFGLIYRLNSSGNIQVNDTIRYTVLSGMAALGNGNAIFTGSRIKDDEPVYDPIAFWPPFFVESGLQFFLADFVYGKYSSSAQTKLGFNNVFWTNTGWNRNWYPTARCPGGSSFDIEYRLTDGVLSAGNTLFIELSDTSGQFTNPLVIGAISTQSTIGSITCQLPANLINSANYLVRIRSTAPALNGVQQSLPVNISAPLSNIALSGPINTFCSKAETLSVITSANIYQWQRNSTNIGGATQSTFLPNQSGTYRCIVTDFDGCSRASSNQLNLTVLPLPNATITPTGNFEICNGDSLQITVPAIVGNAYQWFRGSTTLSGQILPVYQAKTAGNYKVRVTGANGCTRTSSAVKLSVYKPVIQAFGPTTFCAGGSVVLGAQNSSSTTTWQWTRNNILIAGAGSQFYTATQQGTYRVIGTRTSGCTATSSSIAVTVNCREGENYVQESFAIFPNPANEQATVVFEGRDDGDILLTCTDLMGRQVQQITVNASEGQQQININTGALEPGVYIISLIYPDSNVRTARLIVSR